MTVIQNFISEFPSLSSVVPIFMKFFENYYFLQLEKNFFSIVISLVSYFSDYALIYIPIIINTYKFSTRV